MSDRTGAERPTGGLRRVLILVLSAVAISAATIVAISQYTRDRVSLGDVLRVGLGTIGLGLVMVVVSWLVDGLRLLVLARAMGGSVSYLESVRISVAGAFMSGITPSDTGGEPLKVYYLHRDGMSIGQATATVTLIALLHATTRFLLWLAVPLVAFILGLSWQFSAHCRSGFGIRTRHLLVRYGYPDLLDPLARESRRSCPRGCWGRSSWCGAQ